MKKTIVLWFLALFCGSLRAEFNAYDYESISITSNTAVGFSAGKLAPTNGPRPQRVVFTVELDDIRFRLDGTSPTISEGHLVRVSTQTNIPFTEILGSENIQKFKAIGVDNTITLKATYER